MRDGFDLHGFKARSGTILGEVDAQRLRLRRHASPQPALDRRAGIAAVRRLVASADGLIEGFRPGVMERLGLGPDVLLADNPKLVYGRMTG